MQCQYITVTEAHALHYTYLIINYMYIYQLSVCYQITCIYIAVWWRGPVPIFPLNSLGYGLDVLFSTS